MKKIRNFATLLAFFTLIANQSFAQTIVCSDIQIKVGDSVMDPAIVDEFGCDFTPTSAKEDCSLVSFPVFFDYEGMASPEPTSFPVTTLTVQGTVIGGTNVVIDPLNTGRCESQNLTASANPADNTFQVVSNGGATISFATAQNPSFWIFVEAQPGEIIEIDITSVVRTIDINNQTSTCTLSESTPANPIANQQILDDLITIKEGASSCQLTDMSLAFSVEEDPANGNQTVTVSFNHDNPTALSFDKLDGMIKITDMDGNLEIGMPTEIMGSSFEGNNFPNFDIVVANNITTIYFQSENLSEINSTDPIFEFIINSPANQDEDGEAQVEAEWSRCKADGIGLAECCQPTLPTPETLEFSGVPDCAGTPDVSFSVSPAAFTQSNSGCTGNLQMVISADKLAGESFSQFEMEVVFTTTGNIAIDAAATLLAFDNNSDIGCPNNNTSGYPDCIEVSVNDETVTYVFWTFPEYSFPTDELGLAVVFTGDNTGCVTGADFRMSRINSSNTTPSFNCVPTYTNWSGSHCLEFTKIVSGKTESENGAGVPDVTIEVSDSDCATTLTTACNSGNYLFQCQDTEATITPKKNDAFDCGVTTFDLVKMRRHILQIEFLDSPYKLIAADVNNSGSVTTIDLVKMRQLILNINSDFGVNGDISWKFFPENFSFPNPTNPFNPAYPNSVLVNLDCTQESMVDFVAVKMGDVNQSCDLCNTINANNELGEPIVLTIDKEVLASGKVDFRFKVEGFTDIVAFQMDLEYDKNVLSFDRTFSQDLEAVYEDYFGINTIGEGKIRTLWYAEDGLPQSLANFDRIFKILFNGTGNLSNAAVTLFTNDGARLRQPTYNNIAYDAEGKMHPIIQRFGEIKQQLISHAAFPNPFSDRVQLKLEADTGDFVQISVYDSSGKAVYTDKKYLYAQENIISIPASTEWSEGVYFYEVQTNQEKYTGKIVKQ